MSRTAIKVIGVPQALAKLGSLAVLGPDAALEATRIVARAVAEEAKQTTAWSDVTGETRRSIRVSERGKKSTSVLAGSKAAGPAALFLEIGTSKMSPKPYMRPAIDHAAPLAVNEAIETVRRRIYAVGAM